MRSRLVLGLALVLTSLPVGRRSAASAQQGGLYDAGLTAGEYLRLGGGVVTPVNPQGSLHNWKSGSAVSLLYETWQAGSGGVSRVGLGIGIDVGRLPFDAQPFMSDFQPTTGGRVTSATASSATQFTISTTLRVRIPAPLVMPSVLLSFGYMDFKPGTIHYTSTTGDGSATQQHRKGAAVGIGGGLDRTIADRFGLFAEALYSYGFTSLGRGIANPGGTCTSNGCDVLKNTALGMIRGGLRVQTGR